MDFSLQHFIYSDHRVRYLICFHSEKYFNPRDEFLVFSSDSDDPQIDGQIKLHELMNELNVMKVNHLTKVNQVDHFNLNEKFSLTPISSWEDVFTSPLHWKYHT